ncbi:MAG: DUF5684 domain-containing protein [Candidatus Zixiibacteriota bacterium]
MNDGTYEMTTSTQAGPIGMIVWLVMIAIYLYFAFMQYKIAQNCSCKDNAWWSFIPIMNTVLLVKMSGKPMWWFLMLLVPMVNIIAFFVLWVAVAKNCGQSAVWGVMTMIPPISFVAFYILAYKNKPLSYPTGPYQYTQPRTPQQVV